MAKLLKDILETYAPRSKDEKQFYNMHKVEVIKNKSPATMDDKLFNATNIKQAGRKPDRHGYEPGEDLDKYDAGRATVPGTMKSATGKQFPPTTTYEDVDEAYSKDAVDKAIASSNRAGRRIGGREGKMIHALLKGRTSSATQTAQQDKVFKDEGNRNSQIKKEEVETIDEAKKFKIKHFSTKEKAIKFADKAKALGHTDISHGLASTSLPRVYTVHYKLGKRVVKEDIETIDELSKGTLGRYIKKAAQNRADLTAVRTHAKHRDKSELSKSIKNRKDGINKAVDKLAKEDVDVLAEEYESDHHYHHDQFRVHNEKAVQANELHKHYDLNAELGMKVDPERSAMHYNLSDMYKKIATQHLKMAAHHARKAGLKRRD
jgi:hypothetical protein